MHGFFLPYAVHAGHGLDVHLGGGGGERSMGEEKGVWVREKEYG